MEDVEISLIYAARLKFETAGRGGRESMGKSKTGTNGKMKVLLTLSLSHLEKPHLLFQLHKICAGKYEGWVQTYSNELNGSFATNVVLAAMGTEDARCIF